MGRGKVIDSASAFHRKIVDFIGDFNKSGEAPTDHALWQYLNVQPSEFEHLSKGLDKGGKPWSHGTKIDNDPEARQVWAERDKREAEDAAKKLVAFREDRLVKQLEESRTTSSNVIFQLKQAKNGGYQDIQTTDTNASVTIKIDGIGGLDAFK